MADDREQREDAFFIGRFDEIADMIAPLCRDPKVNEAYRLMFALRSQLARASIERERIAARMDELAGNYPEDVFPSDSTSRDGISGTAMRHAYRTAARMIREEESDA